MTDQFFRTRPSLTAYNSRSKPHTPNKFHIFGNVRTFFSIFSLPHRKKIQTILIRPILNFDALPIAHFETYVPLFLKHLWKLAISLKLWVPAHFEVGWSRTVAAQIAVFRPFFGRKWSLTAKPSTFDPIVLYIIGKLCIWRVWNSGGKSFFDHL